jgi:short-subunit dehydrogenase
MTNNTLTPTRPLEPQHYALVIGASSGIGAALVKALVQQAYRVAAIARRTPELEALQQEIDELHGHGRCLIYSHDVTDTDEIPGLFQKITQELGGLDLVIYNAGVQPRVDLKEYNFGKDALMIQVNLLGAIAWLNETAVRFERAGQGHIVGIGSIAGDRGRVGAPAYNSSKAGFHTYLEALRNRLTRQGIRVTTIKPGFVQTKLLEGAATTFWVITPEHAANSILQAVKRRKQTVYVPARWGWVLLIIRHIPSFIFQRLRF